MTEETHNSYRGVICFYCAEPVAIPARLASFEVAARNAEPDVEADHQSRVFILRCGACHKEAPYRMNEIRDFPGKPKPRTHHSRPLTSAWHGSKAAAKAAHG